MKFFALLALAPLALAFPGKRQGQDTPACVLECFSNAGDGPCGMADIQCQCTNQESQKISTQCLVDTCSPDEFSAAVAFAAGLCSGQGFPIQTESLPEGVTAPAGYLESVGLAPAETGAAETASSAASSASAAASSATESATSAPTGTPKPSTTGTGTTPASSSAAASPTTTNGAMATGVVNGFVAVAGLGAALLAF